MLEGFNQLDDIFKTKITKPKIIVVVKAAQDHALHSVFEFANKGYLVPILIDSKEKIDELLLDINTKNSNFEIIDIEDDVSAAKKGIELVREGKADFIMKGNLPTSTLLREVVNKETGIKKSSVLFHLALLDIPKYNKLLGITDGGMILEPSEEQKIKIIEETSKIFTSLGYEKIKFSLLSAAEVVNPKQKSSVEAD